MSQLPNNNPYLSGVCNAAFNRADHLVRHVRSHGQQRPFTCSICNRAFTRQDLLRRHVMIHPGYAASGRSRRSVISTASDTNLSPRVYQACQRCATKKLKCTDEKPCKRCRGKGLRCETSSQEEVITTRHLVDALPPSGLQPTSPTADTLSAWNIPILKSGDHDEVADSSLGCANPDLGDHILESLEIPDLGFSADIDSYLSFDNMDLALSPNGDISMDSMNLPAPQGTTPAPSIAAAGLGTEAFQLSEVLTGETRDLKTGEKPAADDRSVTAIPSEAFSGPIASYELHGRRMSVSTRDRIYRLLLRGAPRDEESFVLESFPSVNVLEKAISHAIGHMKDNMTPDFIHAPSFDVDNTLPELLGAVIAYGCVASCSATLRHFGYEVQEVIQRVMFEKFGDRRANDQSLGLIQAFYLLLYTAYWSARTHKIEKAESASLLGVTLLRRGNHLRQESYQAPEAFLQLTNLSLEDQWLCWVEKESMKRLVCFALTLDTNISLARKIPTSFLLSELRSDVPSVSSLWAAKSADDWLQVLLHDDRLRLSRAPTLFTAMKEPSMSMLDPSVMDMQCWKQAFLARSWNLIVHHHQEKDLALDDPTNLPHLYADLDLPTGQPKTMIPGLSILSPQVEILESLLLLHLHVPFDSIYNYAGRGSAEDANLAVSHAHRWFQSSTTKDGISHAVEIFRKAKVHKAHQLTDMSVLALYHASVALWVWSILSRTQIGSAEHDSSASADICGYSLPFDEPALIVEHARDIIKSNWGQVPFSATTQDVFRILEKFCQISRQHFPVVRPLNE